MDTTFAVLVGLVASVTNWNSVVFMGSGLFADAKPRKDEAIPAKRKSFGSQPRSALAAMMGRGRRLGAGAAASGAAIAACR